MNKQDYLQKYIEICTNNIRDIPKIRNRFKKLGIHERFIFENLNIGFATGNLPELIGENKELHEFFTKAGILKNKKETHANVITIPIYDENKAIINIAFYNPDPRSKNNFTSLSNDGIFNEAYLANTSKVILAANPIQALNLIQSGFHNTTFLTANTESILEFVKHNNFTDVIFAMDGHARLFHAMTTNNINVHRLSLDFDAPDFQEALTALLDTQEDTRTDSEVNIRPIEKGFLFQFPHLNYRVIGNFTENSMSLKANIKAFTKSDAFVDAIDLYKNRERQNFVHHVMDRFSLRDQIQLEQDLNTIINTIEKHKEQKASENRNIRPELTDIQKDIGTTFLTNPNLIDELTADIDSLGYVRERKNKIILYLIMTSRLLENPLHALIISRSGAGKSGLVDIIESLCPPEELQSISDLSAQALYYFGQDDLKHKFIVVGEKEGSKGSEYPLRELISKKSLTKAVPMKDPATGQIKTAAVKVNGPIALVETTTSDVNPENLNRCFVISIDESEEQTRLIHDNQRLKYTIEGRLLKKEHIKIREKHIYAQRLLKKILVFNPYAPLLTFPTSRLQTRRDNEKMLKLINAICFLHQYQRPVKTLTLDTKETIEYIECTVDDYRIAYDLLADGILDNTMDDLPRPARELLHLLKDYLNKRSESGKTAPEQVLFTRKELREHTNWSFAQIRNNVRTLKEYEYIQVIKNQTGTAHQYKLNGSYSDIDFLNTILTPEELEKRIKASEQEKKQPTKTGAKK